MENGGRVVVTRSNYDSIIQLLSGTRGAKSVDTETTGLMPYQSDRLFSVIISTVQETYYFNFHYYLRLDPEFVIPRDWLWRLGAVFCHPDDIWFAHNAKFDLHFLAKEGIQIAGTVHCTRSGARLEYNAHPGYKLEQCAERLGLKKDDAVEKYIKEHKLYEMRKIPGKKTREKFKFFHKVPHPIISEYGLTDAYVGRQLGEHQIKVIDEQALAVPKGGRSPALLLENERRLTKTLFDMERTGLQLDLGYCQRALEFEHERMRAAAGEFEKLTGQPFVDSAKIFAEAFKGETFQKTEKGRLKFDSKVLKSFGHPAASIVLEYRDAKSKHGFYSGFLYHADSDGVVHPNLNSDGTRTGRMSSNGPNFHNLTDESEELEKNPEMEFAIRKAAIARPGFFFFNPDFDQMEFKVMLDYSGAQALIQEVLSGKDVHQATADAVTTAGFPTTRSRAKNGNFALIYGSGNAKLAQTIGCSVEEAAKLRTSIYTVAPEIKSLIRRVMNTAERRGYVFNWMGRRYFFPDKKFAYKAPNYLVQGGCADLVKLVMNRLADYLRGRKSRMLLQVHDELLFEIHESESHIIPDLVSIMEAAYPYKHLPLTVSQSYSLTNWAELKSLKRDERISA